MNLRINSLLKLLYNKPTKRRVIQNLIYYREENTMEYFNKTNIVILDENDLFREGMKRILESSEKFEVIGAISTFKALQDVLSQHPDILLIDAAVFQKQYKNWVKQILNTD